MDSKTEQIVLVTDEANRVNDVLVSVIMPVYNVSKYLDECMMSLINQTLKNIEIICVDDGSTDNSLEILKKYAENDDRIIIATQKNQYAPTARNNGYKLARGKYIIHLDSDDFFELNMLQLAYEKAELTQAEICVFQGFVHYDDTKERKLIASYNGELVKREGLISSEELGDYLFEAVYVVPWNKLYLKSFLDGLGLKFQNIRHSDDVSFVYTSVALASKIVFLRRPLVNYRVGRGDSVQDSVIKGGPLILFEAFDQLKKNLLERGVYDKFRVCFANIVCKDISPTVAKFYGTSHLRELHEYMKNNAISKYDLDILNIDNILGGRRTGFLIMYYMITLEFEQFLKVYEIERLKSSSKK